MKMEAFSAKAAEEGQMRRLQEARALEKNRRELERMAKKRCCLQLMPTSVTEKLMRAKLKPGGHYGSSFHCIVNV